MKSLSQKNIDIVTKSLSGNRLKFFLESLNCVQESLKAGGWLPGMSRKADKGFSQGLGPGIVVPKRSWDVKETDLDKARYEVNWCLRSGYSEPTYYQLMLVASDLTKEERKKLSPELMIAWCLLCIEKRHAKEYLDGLRPLPVKTPVGLSPKATKTLKEMNLDIDMPSIKVAKINYYFVPAYWSRHSTSDEKLHGKMMVKEGENKAKYSVLDRRYFIDWTKGIVHGQSRFTHHTGHCEVCGKNIPSWTFVPLEALDKKSGKLVSILSGCDCAKNIFGVKDIGIEIPKEKAK
jgi:hypothetical protein